MAPATSEELKAELTRLLDYLPGKSDQRSARSLAAWSGELTIPQKGFAKILIDRAIRFQASGKKTDSVEDIWSAEAPHSTIITLTWSEQSDVRGNRMIEAIRAVRERTGMGLVEAKEACEAYRKSLTNDLLPEWAIAAQAPNVPNVTQTIVPDASALEAIVKKILEPGLAAVAAQVDKRADERQAMFQRTAAQTIAKQCVDQVLLEMEKRKPREVIVKVTSGDVTRTIKGRTHKSLERAAGVVAQGIPLLLVGPAGSGKSTAGEQIAQGLGTEFYIQGAASGTHEYLGYEDGHGKYHSTPFRQAFEHGGLFMAEELDSGSADVPLILNAGLANGYMHFPDSVSPVKKHKNFRIIGNANTYGTGADRQYVGRTQLDAATIDRFVFLDWAYDEDMELAISGNVEWTKYVQRVRAAVVAEKARIIVSPRASIYGSQLLAIGYPRDVVCDMTIWKGADKALRAKVEARI